MNPSIPIGSPSSGKVPSPSPQLPVHPIVDQIILAALLGLLSWFARGNDPAWLEFNPSPWLMLPLFIGFRYGFWEGVTAALVGVGSSAILGSIAGEQSLGQILSDNVFHYMAFPGVAGLAGFARYLLADRTKELEDELKQLQEDHLRKDAALSLYRENEILLKQSLLLHNAEYVSVTDEMMELFQDDSKAGTGIRLLQLLSRSFGILSAGFYEDTDDDELRQIAALPGDEAELPQSVSRQNNIIDLALTNQKLVTCKSIWNQAPLSKDDTYLAVIPVIEGSTFLVIRRMKLESITWDNFARIESIINWVGERTIQYGGGTIDFGGALERALWLRNELGVPSKVVRFDGKDPGLAECVTELARPIDCVGEVDSDVCVIVPDDALEFGEMISSSIKKETVNYNVVSLEALLGKD